MYRNMSEQEARTMAEMLDRQFEVNGVSYYATAQASPSRVPTMPTIWPGDTAAHVRETVDELRRDGAGE